MKKTILAVAVLVVASWCVSSMSVAKPEFAKKEGKPCITCHVKPMKGDENLNPVGKCYKEKKDLAACTK